MTIFAPSPRNDYAPIANRVIRRLRQTGSDRQIRQAIASHLAAHSSGRCLFIISLLSNLRHNFTNYDAVRGPLYSTGEYSVEYQQVHQTVNECFMEHIIRGLQSVARTALATNSALTEQVSELEQQLLMAQARLDQLEADQARYGQVARAALNGEGMDAADDLLFELTEL